MFIDSKAYYIQNNLFLFIPILVPFISNIIGLISGLLNSAFNYHVKWLNYFMLIIYNSLLYFLYLIEQLVNGSINMIKLLISLFKWFIFIYMNIFRLLNRLFILIYKNIMLLLNNCLDKFCLYFLKVNRCLPRRSKFLFYILNTRFLIYIHVKL
jgi:hypothetical protein